MVDPCLILRRFTKEFRLPLAGNVMENGHGFTHLNVTINEVREVTEGDVRGGLECFPAVLIRYSVIYILVLDLAVVEEEFARIASRTTTKVAPIAKLDFC